MCGWLLLLVAVFSNVRPMASEAGVVYPLVTVRAIVLTVGFAGAGAVLVSVRWWAVVLGVTIAAAVIVRGLTYVVLVY